MSLIVPSLGLIQKIHDRKKTTHRWPAGVAPDGYLRDPKMRPGTQHKVYEHAPHGRYGNKYEMPLLLVQIYDVEHKSPWEWADEEIVDEGFDDMDQFEDWWNRNRAGAKNCKPWHEMQDEQFWIAHFQLVGKTQYYDIRVDQFVRLGR